MKHLIISIITIIFFLLTSCVNNGSIVNIQNDSIEGIWYGVDNNGDILYLSFNSDNSFEIHDNEGNKLNKDIEYGIINYEIIDNTQPKQIYLILKLNNNTRRTPFGIYKIDGNNLIIRDVIEYRKSIGGFDMGVSRYEVPKDFNGVITKYKRVDKIVVKASKLLVKYPNLKGDDIKEIDSLIQELGGFSEKENNITKQILEQGGSIQDIKEIMIEFRKRKVNEYTIENLSTKALREADELMNQIDTDTFRNTILIGINKNKKD